jgi:hypothetical protein
MVIKNNKRRCLTFPLLLSILVNSERSAARAGLCVTSSALGLALSPAEQEMEKCFGFANRSDKRSQKKGS